MPSKSSPQSLLNFKKGIAIEVFGINNAHWDHSNVTVWEKEDFRLCRRVGLRKVTCDLCADTGSLWRAEIVFTYKEASI